MKRLGAVLMIVGASILAGAAGVSADDKPKLLFDRGLPTANLNNISGGLRSNVAWTDWEPGVDPKTGSPTESWLAGDDFTITQPGQYEIRTIRVWVVGDVPNGKAKHDDEKKGRAADRVTLWGGSYTSGIGPISTTYRVTPMTYQNGEGYQGSAGGFHQINQVDFDVNVDVRGGEAFTFFVDGPWTPYDPADPSQGVLGSFLHASNRVLSGSTQTGANDWFFFLHRKDALTVGIETWNSMTGEGTECPPDNPCRGWDKPSDANVQVFGEMRKKK